MATAAQITANRQNAQLSTGPVTADGKTRVAQNALKHGLTAKHLIVRDDEREEFEELRGSLAAELDPRGAVETLTFNEVLHAAWNLRRFRRLEAETTNGALDDLKNPETAALLDRLARCQARAQRAWYRALAELRTLQTNRASRAFKLHPHDEPEVPAIADIEKVTKQTQSDVKAEAVEMALRLSRLEHNVHLNEIFNRRRGEIAPAAPRS